MEIIFGLVSQIIDLNKNEGVVLLHTWYFNIEVTLKHKKNSSTKMKTGSSFTHVSPNLYDFILYCGT